MELQDITFDELTETHKRHRLDAIKAWAQGRSMEGPVHVEIGSNRGRFLKGLARLHPTHSVLGIELRRRFVEVLNEELAAEGPANAHILDADARLALPLIFADQHVARFYVLFPDPWWKRRHAKRRLLEPTFLSLLADKIKPDGLLIIKTDVEPYAESVAQLLAQSRRWRRLEPGDPLWPQDEAQWPQTTRERKILNKGLPTWHLYATPTGETQENKDLSSPTDMFEKPAVSIDRAKGRRPRIRK